MIKSILRLVGALVMVGLAVASTGCQTNKQLVNWADKVQSNSWSASYEITFYQEDGDITMRVIEKRAGDVLSLEITTPGGMVLKREFANGSFSSDLDGQIQWAQLPGAPPHWTIFALASLITSAENLEKREDWLRIGDLDVYPGKLGFLEIRYLEEWTLKLTNFTWH